MKNLSLPVQIGPFEQWAKDCFDQIERASNEDVETAIADFKVTGTLTELRTINAGTATLTDLRNFICTLVSDIQRQGQKRSQ